MKWTCECGAVLDYKLRFDGDVPEGWYRVEDSGAFYVLCSLKCLRAFVETEAAAVDPVAAQEKPHTKSTT